MVEHRYTVRYEQHRSGWRAATTVRGAEVAATGRTLVSARRAAVDAIALAGAVNRGDGVMTATDGTRRLNKVVADDEVALSAGTRRALAEARAARRAALEAVAESHEATVRAVRALVDAGLSYRDVGYLVGLSHGRVQQLLDGDGTAATPRRRKTKRGAR